MYWKELVLWLKCDLRKQCEGHHSDFCGREHGGYLFQLLQSVLSSVLTKNPKNPNKENFLLFNSGVVKSLPFVERRWGLTKKKRAGREVAHHTIRGSWSTLSQQKQKKPWNWVGNYWEYIITSLLPFPVTDLFGHHSVSVVVIQSCLSLFNFSHNVQLPNPTAKLYLHPCYSLRWFGPNF